MSLIDLTGDENDYQTVTENIVQTSSQYVDITNQQGYGVPLQQSTISYNDNDNRYIWGSNSFVADNSIVMAYAYYLTGNEY